MVPRREFERIVETSTRNIKKVTENRRSHRKLTYKTTFRIMVQIRKFKEIDGNFDPKSKKITIHFT